MPRDFIILPHTADIRLSVTGKTKKDLFRHALKGMFAIQNPVIIEEKTARRKFSVKSLDNNALLVDFLNEAIADSDSYNEIYGDARFTLFEETVVRGEFIGNAIKKMQLEIKAATLHELDIRKEDNLWQTNIVFDI